ncbi:MAG: ATP-binding protein [Lachnospiraceae bacterium]|nr:ATP-binding protein [Lachnospiraceae bacterium]
MDKDFEKQYMYLHEIQMTKKIHLVCIILWAIMPTLFLCNKMGIFDVSNDYIQWGSVLISGGWITVEILLRCRFYRTAKYVQLIYIELLVGVLSGNCHIGIYLTYFAIPLLSCVYLDWVLTLATSLAGYIVMLAFLWPRAIGFVENGFTNFKSIEKYFMAYGMGYTIEYVMMTIFAILVVRHGKEIRQNFFETQREKLSAEASSEAKTSFLANMSHEIRTPINAIIGMDEMIIRESKEAGIIRYANNIRNASKTLLSLINDILDFSKVESGKMEIINSNYQVSSMLNDLVNMIQSRASDKSLELILDIDEQLPCELYGDEVRLRQIITNLLTNAVKYTKEGSVTLKIRVTKLENSIGRLDVAVIDTGIGIRKEDQGKLFDSFQRVDEAKNHNIEGTGLGLALTKYLLEAMGSKLLLESEYGKGSAFYFGLEQKIVDDTPIGDYQKMYEKSRQENERYRESFQAPDALILVVDDTRMNLEVCKGLLKKTKVQIDVAESGAECLQMCEQKEYHLILLDHKMPHMDGVECLQRIRQQEEGLNTNTTVIALTANAITGAKEYYLKNGFDDYLSKPVQGEKLEQLLCQYLPSELLLSPEEATIASYETMSTEVPEIIGIDEEDALSYAGESQEEYLKNLKLYLEEYDSKRTQIQEAFEKDDWENYQILAHSIKSTSRLIGANDMSLLAKSMEEAAAKRNAIRIRGDHEVFMDQYERLCQRIKVAVANVVMTSNVPELKPVSKDEMHELISHMKTSVDEFDMSALHDQLEQLIGYDYLKNVKDHMQEAVENFDYDAISTQVEVLENLVS